MLDNLGLELQNAQNKCIGLFKTRGQEYLVMSEHKESGTINCITIGTLFGLHSLSINKSQGKYVKFPKKQTLGKMLERPSDFMFWYRTKMENKPY